MFLKVFYHAYARVIRVTHTYIIYVYSLKSYNYIITAVLLHVVGTQEVEIQYTAVRMHIRGCTYQVHIVSYIATTNNNSGSATAANCVCCCLPCAFYDVPGTAV